MVDRALEDIDAAIQEAENDVRNATRHSAHTAFKWHLDNLKRFRRALLKGAPDNGQG